MFRNLLLVLSFLICTNTFAQNYSNLRTQAQSAGQEKDYHKAVELYREAFTLETLNRTDLYNAACFASLAGDKNQAFIWLEKAVQLGYINIQHLKSDSDLLNLHSDSKWETFISELSQKIARIEEKYNKPLQKELLQIYESDQKYRLQYIDMIKKHEKNSNFNCSFNYCCLWCFCTLLHTSL